MGIIREKSFGERTDYWLTCPDCGETNYTAQEDEFLNAYSVTCIECGEEFIVEKCK